MNNREGRNGGDFRDIKHYSIEFAALSEAKPRQKMRANEDSHVEYQKGNLFVAVVADGIGGAPGGNIASQLMTAASKEVVEREAENKTRQPLLKILADMIETGDTDIRGVPNIDPKYRGLGTTFAGLIIRGNEFACANVGDTRIYRKRGKTWVCLSKDHTLSEEMLEKSATPEEAAQKNHFITQAVGHGMRLTEPNYRQLPLFSGEIFLLTSDGIHTKLTDEELFVLINEQDSAKTIAQKVIAAAKDLGLTDDATVVAVKVTK